MCAYYAIKEVTRTANYPTWRPIMSDKQPQTNSGNGVWFVLLAISVTISAGILAYGFMGQKPPTMEASTPDSSMIYSPTESALQPEQNTDGMEIDQKVPQLTVKDINGKSITLPDGKPRVLFFANLTCPCVKAYDERMKAIHEKYASKGIEVAYVFSDVSDTLPNIRNLVTSKEYPWRNIVDDDQKMMRLFNVEATTETVLIDGKGNLRYHGRVDDNIYDPEKIKSHDLDNAINAVLAGKEVPVKEARALSCRIPRI